MQGDDNLRLGLQVQGAIAAPGEEDVYTFQGTAGTEVWLDLGQTSYSLDTELELLDPSTGDVLAWSDNSWAEEAAAGTLQSVTGESDPGVVSSPSDGGSPTLTIYTLAHTPSGTVTGTLVTTSPANQYPFTISGGNVALERQRRSDQCQLCRV